MGGRDGVDGQEWWECRSGWVSKGGRCGNCPPKKDALKRLSKKWLRRFTCVGVLAARRKEQLRALAPILRPGKYPCRNGSHSGGLEFGPDAGHTVWINSEPGSHADC